MEAVLSRISWRASSIDWEALVPKCSWSGCRRRRARWQGLLHRADGVRCGDDWYCGPDCLQEFLVSRLYSFLAQPPSETPLAKHRVPLGLILLSRGHIEHDSLQKALEKQRAEGGRVGDCLRRYSEVTEDQITSALAKQWSVPVFPPSRGSECRHLLPRRLQEFHRMLPVHFVEATRDLYVAFGQFVDYTALLAIEQMLNCHTRPCILPETELLHRLAEERMESVNAEIVFASTITPHELASSICGYVQQTGAERVRLLSCGAHIWVRLDASLRSLDLLVRRWQR